MSAGQVEMKGDLQGLSEKRVAGEVVTEIISILQ